MKKIFFFAATALALTACTSDDFIGTEKTETDAAENAITFSGGAGKVQRDTHTDAAVALDNNFILYGWKTTGGTAQDVFDHYNVNYVASTAHTTPSNSSDWEYVNQSRIVKGTNDKTLGKLASDATQEIKYWDFAADRYDFIAFSLGKGVTVDETTTYASVVTATGKNGIYKDTENSNIMTYKLSGSAEQLAASYIADQVTRLKTNYSAEKETPVQFQFRSLGSKVRMGIYETIPGYSISAITFYPSAAGSAAAPAMLFTDGTHKLPSGNGTMTVTIDANNQAHASFAATDAATNVTNKSFGTFTLDAAADKKEATGNYLGRTSNTATIANKANDNGYAVVLPNEAGVEGGLTLKVDYTLLAIDGSGEEIHVVGATATVPQQFTQWKPNFAYTYLFKISQNTNGSIGDLTGLYPITLDAIVVETETGVQETITTVATPSITTYAKGVNPTVAATAEYATGSNIYVSVTGATLTAANSKLYTVTNVKQAGGAENPAQEITEESVANAIVNDQDGASGAPYSVTDANKWKMTVTDATPASNFIVTEIAASDAPDGNAISGNFAKFTPAAAGTYVFEYIDGSSNKHYKVIKVQ